MKIVRYLREIQPTYSVCKPREPNRSADYHDAAELISTHTDRTGEKVESWRCPTCGTTWESPE